MELVRIEKISNISPIEGADAIECAYIGGWPVVVKKNEFQVGEEVVYFQIDSFLPSGNPAWDFLVEKSSRTYKGVKGHRLRTVKLRGQISQGLILPTSILQGGTVEGLGVLKYEDEIPAQLSGLVKGNFPSFIPKTDQERVQNINLKDYIDRTYEVTEKLEGSSMTVYLYEDLENIGVCSRNLELKEQESNSFWAVALRDDFKGKLASLGKRYAFQGELVGPGIQKNIYKLDRHEFYLYDIYDIENQEFLNSYERRKIAEKLSINICPVVFDGLLLDDPASTQSILNLADGKSRLFDTNREGLVFKDSALSSGKSFKAISNKYLLKQK